jgi:hypothetical protein
MTPDRNRYRDRATEDATERLCHARQVDEVTK